MLSRIGRKLAAARRVLDFTQAHPSTDTSFNELVAGLTERVTRLEALGVTENAGTSVERAAFAQRHLTRRILLQRLSHLVRVAKVASLSAPLAQDFTSPRGITRDQVLVAVAQRMFADASAEKDRFLKAGMGDGFLEALAGAITAFETSSHAANGGRAQHVGAGHDQRTLAREAMLLVGALDGVVKDVFGADQGALGEWQSARSISDPVHHPGPPAPDARKAA
ncbi:MAG TPA: hypothetical protein VID74_05650 [Gemmatimonadales bacterium]|jgi:hypothetical protein